MWVEQCGDGEKIERLEPNELPGLRNLLDPESELKTIALVNAVGEATVDVTVNTLAKTTFVNDAPAHRSVAASEPLRVQAQPTRSVPLTVTYFDMPMLEQLRLADGRRLSLTLADFGSTRSCQSFREQMGTFTKEICDVLLDDQH